MEKGVGRKSVASDGHTTDAVYSLQAGKTVDILRCAAESTDLLPPSALPRSLRSLRLSQPSRPTAGRLPAVAGHRAAVVIKGDVVSGVVVVRVFCQRVRHSPIRCCAIGSLIPYQMIERKVSTLPIGVTAIGDLESNDDSRLRRNSAFVGCEGRCGAFVVGHSLRPTASVRCEYGNVVSCGRQVGLRPRYPPCWGQYAPRGRLRRRRRAGQ